MRPPSRSPVRSEPRPRGGAAALLGIACVLVELPAAALLPSDVAAAPKRASSPGAPFRAHTLSNGLTVLLSPSPAHPVIALSAFVTTGGRTEDEHYQGSLHYIEHLVYKGGTPNLPPTEFRKKLSTLGREAGGWTWDDEINFGFETPKENFGEALGIFHEALHDLQFEEPWFEDEKRVVLQEMQQGLEEPGSLIYEIWDALAFDLHAYGRSVIGTEEAILGLKMRPTEQYYRDRFTPNHMIVAVAGDFGEKAMLAELERAWGGDARGPESFELGFVEPPIRGPRRRVEHLPQATNAMLLTGFVTEGGAGADTPALVLLAELMNHPSFGLPQYLQQQAIWVSDVSASHYAMKDFGLLRVFARTDPEKAAAVEEFVASYLRDFDATKLPAEAFETTRRQVLASEARQRETAADRAERLGLLASRHGVEGAASLLERIEKLKPADVQTAKARWVDARKTITTAVYPDSFDPTRAAPLRVEARAPNPPPLPSLDAPGALAAAKAPALAYEIAAPVDGVTKITFANGLRVLVRPSDASTLVAITGRMLGGQWVEPPGKDGINRFTSELGLVSTRRWNEEAFQLLLGSMGATASSHVSIGSRANTSRNMDYRDGAAHHANGLASQWKALLACVKESLFFPEFESSAVERVRTNLLTEIAAIEEDQLEQLKQDFYVRAYDEHPYGRPTVGTKATVGAITVDDLAAFHAKEWAPDRCVVSVVGSVDPKEVAAWIATRWADLPDRRAGAVDAASPEGWSFEAPEQLQTLERGKDYWTVNWGKPGAAWSDPKWTTSVVLSQIAGNDHFYKYVYGEGVSYRSWIRFWPNLGSGTWIVENDVKRERFDEILGKFDEDLARYASQGFTEKEFADAVQRLVNSDILDAQTNSILAWKLAVAEGNGNDFTRATKAVQSMRGVGYDEAQELAREVFPPRTMLRLVQK